jgi:hypothetical protein
MGRLSIVDLLFIGMGRLSIIDLLFIGMGRLSIIVHSDGISGNEEVEQIERPDVWKLAKLASSSSRQLILDSDVKAEGRENFVIEHRL